ncbi:MAG: uroporphyrinogen-III synthase [Mangrovibacterium sp.]
MRKIICAFHKPELEAFERPDLLFAPVIKIEGSTYRLSSPLESYDWLLFTSKNGIRYFKDFHDGSYRGKIAVLGSSTAKELEKYGYKADFIGDGSSSTAMAAALSNVLTAHDKVLAVLGQMASFNLQMGLKMKVDRVDVYDTILESLQDKESRQLILADEYKLILAASPSAVKSLVMNFGGRETKWRVACIGETTAQACKAMGIKPVLIASQQSFETLLNEATAYDLIETEK